MYLGSYDVQREMLDKYFNADHYLDDNSVIDGDGECVATVWTIAPDTVLIVRFKSSEYPLPVRCIGARPSSSKVWADGDEV